MRRKTIFFGLAIMLVLAIIARSFIENSSMAREKRIDFEVVWQGQNHNFYNAERMEFWIITNSEEWKEFTRKYQLSWDFKEFDKYFLIAALLGVKPSSGYGIKINKIVQTGSTIKVIISTKKPERGALDVITSPYSIVKVNKDSVDINDRIMFVFLNASGEMLDVLSHDMLSE